MTTSTLTASATLVTNMETSAVSGATSTPRAFSPSELANLKETFAEEGYLVFRSVVSKDKLSQLRTSLVDAYERAQQAGGIFAGGGGGQLAGHLNSFPGEESRFTYEAIQESGLLDLIKALSPQVARAPNVGCNLNLPNSMAQHYHADTNYFVEHFMVANIAVVDTDLANGAIDIVPGTHKKFYKYWRFALERPYRNAKRIPMEQGDVLLRSSNLWHRGMPNFTTAPRPMVALTWEDGGSTRPDPFRANDGKITFHPNWFRPSVLGRLRERTYAAVPLSYSAYRFARSLIGNKGHSRKVGR